MTLFALCILSSSYTSTIVGVLEVVDYGYAASILKDAHRRCVGKNDV